MLRDKVWDATSAYAKITSPHHGDQEWKRMGRENAISRVFLLCLNCFLPLLLGYLLLDPNLLSLHIFVF